MSINNTPRGLVREYTLVTVVAILIMLLLLFAQGLGLWALMPAVIAVGALLARLAAGPAIFLLALAALMPVGRMLGPEFGFNHTDGGIVFDILLAIVVLAYCAGHMRLLTTASHALPPDTRRERKPTGQRVRGRWLLPGGPARRTIAGDVPGELIRLFVTLPLFGLGATLVYLMVAFEPSMYPDVIADAVWQVFLVLWVLGLVLLLANAILGYVGRLKASREESLLFLQDHLWTATRGEQRRVARWLAWGRLRKQHKKEH